MNNMKIAGRKSVEEWYELKRNLVYNDNTNWNNAFDFFYNRIESRYFDPIIAISNIGKEIGEGFAIVSLQCALIETLECFINGAASYYAKGTKWGDINGNAPFIKVKDVFVSFFKNRQPFESYQIDGTCFYYNVRCGLLHETQTKNGWRILACNSSGTKSIDEKVVYRQNLQIDLELLIYNYKTAIVEGSDFNGITNEALRKNFIFKFDHLCHLSL